MQKSIKQELNTTNIFYFFIKIYKMLCDYSLYKCIYMQCIKMVLWYLYYVHVEENNFVVKRRRCSLLPRIYIYI
jgi:hypothetical protein